VNAFVVRHLKSASSRCTENLGALLRLWTQRFVGEGRLWKTSHSGQARIDRGGREVFLFEKEPVTKDNSSVESKTRFGAILPDKLVDGMTV